MKNTIQTLSNKVINQIAAGEVIQRPASIVKELLENAIDADATSIHIIVKNAGKTLIQVIDNGCGMNEKDAEICFLKHTTSKIKTTEDIMKISTMGFRGEALASIASVAEVELKTKKDNEEIGTVINIANSQIKKIKKTAAKKGTSISVKNLFFNIPARKNFLKSDKIELKHIIDTFTQITIAHPNIEFKLNNNENTIYNLVSTNLKNRIIHLFGKKYKEKILDVKEETTIVSINGFIGNPLDAKRTRGEQFLYVNNRFIKSGYLNHAIKTAMENMITKEQYPSYFIFLKINPNLIDINIHPNKTEIKFEDEKAIYQILKSCCKRTLGMSHIQPSLDFSIEESFEVPIHIQKSTPKEPKLNINTNFNPFQKETKINKENTENIHKLFDEDEEIVKKVINIDRRYGVFITYDNDINLIDKKKAFERITYEKTKKILNEKRRGKQFVITPIKIDLSFTDIQLLQENINLFNTLGYEIQSFSDKNIMVNAVPFDFKNENPQEIIEFFVEELKSSKDNINDKLIKKITYQKSINFNIDNEDMLRNLIVRLTKCEIPFIGIDGKPCVINIEPSKIFN